MLLRLSFRCPRAPTFDRRCSAAVVITIARCGNHLRVQRYIDCVDEGPPVGLSIRVATRSINGDDRDHPTDDDVASRVFRHPGTAERRDRPCSSAWVSVARILL